MPFEKQKAEYAMYKSSAERNFCLNDLVAAQECWAVYVVTYLLGPGVNLALN